MSSNINILKWLFALVLIFGGFTVYKIFGVLAADLEGKEYVWLVKIISEFGLFTSVVISVGFFHHWIIATEERKETEKMFHHFRMLILKDCPISELCAHEIIGYSEEEFRGYDRLFLASLEDIAGRINERDEGSLGVFVYDSLPNIPLLIILRDKAKIVEIYNSFYLSEPVGRMPYLHWQSELKCDTSYSFESEKWNMPDLFLDYFQRRWLKEINWIVPTKRI